tara:strand:- start:217 stop:660 length:444 start_codon:yes stop_codon:yes gene_type:complete
MASELWWVFVVVGVVLVICEIFIPGFVIMWFGVAAIIAAIPVYLEASMNTIVLVYSVSLILFGIFGRRLAMNYFNAGEDESTKTNVATIIGSIGVVTHKVGLTGVPGRVYVNNESWAAISADGKEIENDTQVIVEKIDGAKLIINKK